MDGAICITCGTQYPPAERVPPSCPICEEPRQYVRATGQAWTTLPALRQTHQNAFRQYEPDLIGIGTVPSFAIGQRALLLRTPSGNVLWDCVSLLDEATMTLIRALGGLAAIAISHPHYYTTMAEWGAAFGSPIRLHAADRQWVMRPDAAIAFWEGERLDLLPGVTLIRCGGHFAGGTVLHWADGAAGRGALLSGDILQVAPDLRHVSFMRSYPNMIPLSRPAIEGITAPLAPYAFDAIYGAFFDRVIPTDGTAALARSASRYIAAISGDGRAEQA